MNYNVLQLKTIYMYMIVVHKLSECNGIGIMTSLLFNKYCSIDVCYTP